MDDKEKREACDRLRYQICELDSKLVRLKLFSMNFDSAMREFRKCNLIKNDDVWDKLLLDEYDRCSGRYQEVIRRIFNNGKVKVHTMDLETKACTCSNCIEYESDEDYPENWKGEDNLFERFVELHEKLKNDEKEE